MATTEVPVLKPGRLAQVALDLAAGTQPEGEAVYRLFADETALVPDVDTNNNTAAFAVNLWLDADGDGMPDGWERQDGMNPDDPADATQDKDGDGVNNLAEYRAGTNPEDPESYLRITSVGVDGASGLQIAWGSTSNRLYTIQPANRSSPQRTQGNAKREDRIGRNSTEQTPLDRTAPSACSLWSLCSLRLFKFGVQVQRTGYLIQGGGSFTNLAEHILRTPPQNVFLDTAATNASQFFYRIKVE